MNEGALPELPEGWMWTRLADATDSAFKKPQINADKHRFIPVTGFIEESNNAIHRKGRKERKAKQQQPLRPLRSLRLNAFSVTELARVHINSVSAFICVHLRLIFDKKMQEFGGLTG